MLTNSDHIEELVEALEVRFLANRDANLHFALLTDFKMPSRKRSPKMSRSSGWRSRGSKD